MKCEDIQSVLFDYMTRELGQGRADLVREHLRKCENCRAATAETRATLDILHNASKAETGIPAHLSKKHRARIIRAFTHPIIDWIYRHHVIVSIIVTVLVIGAVMGILRRTQLWKTDGQGQGIPVTIGAPREAQTEDEQ